MDQDDYNFEFDDPENFHAGPLSVEEELERFRKQWKKEIKDSQGDSSEAENRNVGEDKELGPSIEEQATFLFLQGVNAEQSAKYYEAIQFYRRAVQLVPDIEFKVDEYKPRSNRKTRTISESSVDSTSSGLGEEDLDDIADLVTYFQKLKVIEKGHCVPNVELKTTHICSLPLEVLNYVFKWVVSAELDVLSLEHLSEVSRGFYVCARDEELWRLICQRIWGRNCGDSTYYGSFRNMYYQRPHIRFNGCYINKTSYYRQGEKGLDYYYTPFQIVEYYRYVKFFPDGQMLMLTTPDSPYEVLPKLKYRGTRIHSVNHGYYRLTGDVITGVLRRRKEFKSPYERFKRKNRNENKPEQSFHVEFVLTNCGKRPHSQLDWRYYSFNSLDKQSGRETVTDFDLDKKNYPPLVFSRVKSYTNMAEDPL